MTMPVDMMFKLLEWSLGGDTGSSSKAMLKASLKKTNGDVPHDPSDFGRCYRLLQAVPELRGYFPQMKANCPMLTPYLDSWDDLSRMYEKALSGSTGKAPELYARLKELYEIAMPLAGYQKTHYGWSRANA